MNDITKFRISICLSFVLMASSFLSGIGIIWFLVSDDLEWSGICFLALVLTYIAAELNLRWVRKKLKELKYED